MALAGAIVLARSRSADHLRRYVVANLDEFDHGATDLETVVVVGSW
jgi:hypothetical protein